MLAAGQVQMGGDVKAIQLERRLDLLHLTGNALQIGPAGGVVSDANQQGVALVVEPNLLSGLVPIHDNTAFRRRCGDRRDTQEHEHCPTAP